MSGLVGDDLRLRDWELAPLESVSLGSVEPLTIRLDNRTNAYIQGLRTARYSRLLFSSIDTAEGLPASRPALIP